MSVRRPQSQQLAKRNINQILLSVYECSSNIHLHISLASSYSGASDPSLSKFANAKAISSAQLYGEEDHVDEYDRASRLQMWVSLAMPCFFSFSFQEPFPPVSRFFFFFFFSLSFNCLGNIEISTLPIVFWVVPFTLTILYRPYPHASASLTIHFTWRLEGQTAISSDMYFGRPTGQGNWHYVLFLLIRSFSSFMFSNQIAHFCFPQNSVVLTSCPL